MVGLKSVSNFWIELMISLKSWGWNKVLFVTGGGVYGGHYKDSQYMHNNLFVELTKEVAAVTSFDIKQTIYI